MEGGQRPYSDSWAWPRAKAGSTRSQDFGDTAWILHRLSRGRVAGVSVLCSPCPAAAQVTGLKAGRAFVVLRRAAQWTAEHLLPSRLQLLLTAAIRVAANLSFLSSEVSSAVPFLA